MVWQIALQLAARLRHPPVPGVYPQLPTRTPSLPCPSGSPALRRGPSRAAPRAVWAGAGVSAGWGAGGQAAGEPAPSPVLAKTLCLVSPSPGATGAEPASRGGGGGGSGTGRAAAVQETAGRAGGVSRPTLTTPLSSDPSPLAPRPPWCVLCCPETRLMSTVLCWRSGQAR